MRLMYSLESSQPSNEDGNATSHVILPAFPSFCGHFRPLSSPLSVLAAPPGRPQCRPARHCHDGDEADPRPLRGVSLCRSGWPRAGTGEVNCVAKGDDKAESNATPAQCRMARKTCGIECTALRNKRHAFFTLKNVYSCESAFTSSSFLNQK